MFQTPWLEAMFLAAGANHVTTLEYNTIRNEHPKITAMKPPEFNAAFLDGTLEKLRPPTPPSNIVGWADMGTS